MKPTLIILFALVVIAGLIATDPEKTKHQSQEASLHLK